MSRFGFLYDGHGYEIDHVQWISKPGRCAEKEDSCPMGYLDENGEWKCINNLVGHSCKHVVKGSENEKARYKEVMSEWQKDEIIPESIQRETDDVINNYEEMSKGVLKAPASVSITGEGKNIRIVCDGTGVLDGSVDFMSFETPWRKEYGSDILMKEEDERDKHLGIISSYFNISSGDIYVMYRLVYQRYFEKKKRGRNVSPTIRRTEEYSPSDVLPELDFAFDQARLFYRDKKDENYSLGAMFYFFWSKYVQTELLKKMYLEMIPAFAEHRKPGHLIWNLPAKSNLSEALTKVKIYEHVYSARTMMEYIEIIGGSEFKPDMHLWQGNVGALPYITDYLGSRTGAFYKDKAKTQFELIIQRKLLDRIGNVFETRYTAESLSQIADFIVENEIEDGKVGSVADHASYAVAGYLIEYFVALYVFCHNSHEVYKGDSSHCDYDYIREQIRKWNNCRDNCTRVLRGGLFNEWLNVFNDLYHVEKRLAEIESY